jgi:hypothetical protein
LTASAQSALPFAWDETIVPALRKRKFFKSYPVIQSDISKLEGSSDAALSTRASCSQPSLIRRVSGTPINRSPSSKLQFYLLRNLYRLQVSKARVAFSQSACPLRRYQLRKSHTHMSLILTEHHVNGMLAHPIMVDSFLALPMENRNSPPTAMPP